MKRFLVVVLMLVSAGALAQKRKAKAESGPELEPLTSEGGSREGECGSSLLDEGPITIGFYPAEHSTGRRACARTEAGVILGGGAEIDIPNFRAVLGGGATVFGSYAVMPKLEVFATLDALRFTYAQNASPSATTLALGQLSGGASYQVMSTEAMALAFNARMIVPTQFDTINVHSSGIEGGASLSYRFGDAFEAHAFTGIGATFALFTPGPMLLRPSILLGVGGAWSPASWFALALDVQSHFGDRFIVDEYVDYVAPTLGLRFKPSKSLFMEFGLAMQVAGARTIQLSPSLRTNTVLGLRTAYRF